nr:MAG TPA: hypothetical protein [Bacteriophage sp.]
MTNTPHEYTQEERMGFRLGIGKLLLGNFVQSSFLSSESENPF